MITSDQAAAWASWFRALGDPTRIRLLHALATARRPMRVGALVERVDVGQSTVSHHLRQLADVGFVQLRREGTTTWCEINRGCFAAFPQAAASIMDRGRAERSTDGGADGG
ncbi:MAG: metalloregulator ArsR/SmtB family transcription factor [Candidatus Dormiibacterota bacterium]|jgi:DNA-binding transcriptional ArsR family regulator